VLSAVFGGIVPRSIINFRTTHPDVMIHTRSMLTIEQMKALLDGTLDVGVTIAPDRYPAGLTGFIVDRQPFWLAIPQDNPLAAHEEIEPGMLADEPIVATVLENELAFWSNVRAITPTGMPMRIVSRVPDIFSVMASVAAGIGIGVISESLAQLPVPGVVCRKLVNVARSSDHAAVFRKNEGAQVIKAFIASMKAKAVAPNA
jgi:DNA-binding transcriptional LysR family regulator